MTTRNVNLLWKDFKGIRKLNSINSDTVLGADIAHGVRLSKEKSGQFRSIRSSGWFKPFTPCGTTTIAQTTGSSLSNITIEAVKFAKTSGVTGSGTYTFTYNGTSWVNSSSEEVLPINYGVVFIGTPVSGDVLTVTYSYQSAIRLFSANFSGYTVSANQLIAFTKSGQAINVWLITGDLATINPIQIGSFTIVGASDVTDVCMVQWGDRLGMMIAFGTSALGFVYYSADSTIGGTQFGTTGFYNQTINLVDSSTSNPIYEVSSIKPYRSRLAINGYTKYVATKTEAIYGVWFSEAGNPTTFTTDYMSDASETSAFYVETGEKVNKLEEYHGLTAFCQNRSYNITGTSQNDVRCEPLTAKGVLGNASFTINGKCAYIDSWAKNIFTLRDNIDGTIGFDDPVGDDIQDYLEEVKDVTVNTIGRRVRLLKSSGESLVYDVDIGEWTEETFVANARAVTFLNRELFCANDNIIYEISDNRGLDCIQTPNENGYYSHYRTNLIWLDSQSSVKSHLYPFAIILEPQTSNDFFVKFTTDRGDVYDAKVTRGGVENVAVYSVNDTPVDGSMFVSSDDDISGGVFFDLSDTELLVTVERPPYWRYLQMDIYTTNPSQQFNISGIEAKNTVITDEMLDY